MNRGASAGGKRSSGEYMKRCSTALKQLRQHKWAWVFDKPVNAEEMGLHDYYTVIKKPMDLGTVKRKLDDGLYKSAEDFVSDVRLVWANAKLYNPADNDVHVMAKGMEEIFEKKVPELLAAHDPAADAAGRSKGTPMTFKEKRELSCNMNKLSSKKLGRVVQIIHENDPMLLKQNPTDPEEIEIDIDAIDESTLRYLDKFVKSCLAKKQKKKAGALAGGPDAKKPRLQ